MGKKPIFNCPAHVKRRRVALGRVVRQQRQALDLTQRSLAVRVARDRQTICRTELGQYSPRLDEWWLLADGLGRPLSSMVREAEDAVASDEEARGVEAT